MFTRLPYREDNDDRHADRNSGQRYQLCFILDTSMTHGKIFPRTATPRCLRTCCSRIRKSQLDLAWTTSSKWTKIKEFYFLTIWLILQNNGWSSWAWFACIHWTHWCLLCQQRTSKTGIQVILSHFDNITFLWLWISKYFRSIYWEKEYMEPTAKFFQPAWVVNYPEVLFE